MSKEQTPIKHRGKTLEEWREYVKKDNTSNVRTMKYVWVLEELLRKEQERTNAKVLEALEREFSKLDGIDFSLIGGTEYYETEVKPKYE